MLDASHQYISIVHLAMVSHVFYPLVRCALSSPAAGAFPPFPDKSHHVATCLQLKSRTTASSATVSSTSTPVSSHLRILRHPTYPTYPTYPTHHTRLSRSMDPTRIPTLLPPLKECAVWLSNADIVESRVSRVRPAESLLDQRSRWCGRPSRWRAQ